MILDLVENTISTKKLGYLIKSMKRLKGLDKKYTVHNYLDILVFLYFCQNFVVQLFF